jgi:uncharacterized protein YjiS (DUF1127 family)
MEDTMLAYLDVAGLSHVYEQRRIPRHPRAAGHDAGEAFIAALKHSAARTWAAVARAHERRATIRRLSALDNRALADIGVYRGQIPAVAAAAVDGHDLRRRTETSGHGTVRTDVAPGRAVANDNAAEIAA